uniref:Uncharacterized protein n=1 Tax=Oryza glumipatula TaxID=40148 RepID=A0A0D9ZCK9_9ORYZ
MSPPPLNTVRCGRYTSTPLDIAACPPLSVLSICRRPRLCIFAIRNAVSMGAHPSICLFYGLTCSDLVPSSGLCTQELLARPRLMDFVKGLEDAVVESASRKAFAALPDLCKAITELTVLKGVGPATASAVLAAYAPDVAPFMSDEAMVAALGNAKEYTLKQYLAFAEKLQTKSKELSSGEEVFTTSDVERALWSSAVASKSLKAPPGNDLENKKVIARPERLSYLNIIEHSDSSRKFHKEN